MADWHFRGLDAGVGERFFMVFRWYHSYATWGFRVGRGFSLTEAPQRGRVNLQSGGGRVPAGLEGVCVLPSALPCSLES